MKKIFAVGVGPAIALAMDGCDKVENAGRKTVRKADTSRDTPPNVAPSPRCWL